MQMRHSKEEFWYNSVIRDTSVLLGTKLQQNFNQTDQYLYCELCSVYFGIIVNALKFLKANDELEYAKWLIDEIIIFWVNSRDPKLKEKLYQTLGITT